MSLFKRFIWRDENVQYPNRYLVDGAYKTIVRDVGTITVQDAISSTRMNKLENGLFDAYYAHGGMPIEGAITSLVRVNNKLSEVNETISGVLYRKTTLNRTNGKLTSVNVKIYDTDGITVIKDYTDTLVKTNNKLTSVERVVNI